MPLVFSVVSITGVAFVVADGVIVDVFVPFSATGVDASVRVPEASEDSTTAGEAFDEFTDIEFAADTEFVASPSSLAHVKVTATKGPLNHLGGSSRP